MIGHILLIGGIALLAALACVAVGWTASPHAPLYCPVCRGWQRATFKGWWRHIMSEHLRSGR